MDNNEFQTNNRFKHFDNGWINKFGPKTEKKQSDKLSETVQNEIKKKKNFKWKKK